MSCTHILLEVFALFTLMTTIQAFSLPLRMQAAPTLPSTSSPSTVRWAQRPFTATDFAGHIEAAVNIHADTIAQTMAASPTAICCIDGFVGEDACREMRKEAEAIRAAGKLEECESSGQVRATQVDLELSESLGHSLLLTHTLAITRCLAPIVNSLCPDALLSPSAQTNKLAASVSPDEWHTQRRVTEEDGSAYKRHVDNSFMPGDIRKLTVLYYINPDYKDENGGRFRAFDCRSVRVDGSHNNRLAQLGTEQESVSFAPRGDRLVIFWTDSLVHEVAPSTLSPASRLGSELLPESHAGSDALPEDSHRWALTVWMVTTDPKRSLAHGVRDAVLRRHFKGPLQKEIQRTADRARRLVAAGAARFRP